MDFERRTAPFLFLLTGTLNVLLVKWSDTLQGECRDGKRRQFQHPIFQTALMFLAQFLCFLIYKGVYFQLQRRGDSTVNENFLTRGGREFAPMSVLLPAFLDAIASLLLFTGLYLTYASSFQILRGGAIIFVGIFSSIYLNQTLIARHWIAMFTISCSMLVVVFIDIQRVYYDQASLPHKDENAILAGNLLIICAQVFHAMQMVYLEKQHKGTEIPTLQAVGWQGIFGLVITALIAICMSFLPMALPFADNSRGVFDDFGDILPQFSSNPWIWISLGAFVISCGCYNYVTITIIKFSSTANVVLADGIRVMFVCLAALLLNWEYLNIFTGSAVIILWMGLIAYRNAIFLEWYRSLLARLVRPRYADLTVDNDADGNTRSLVSSSRPADII